MVEPGAEDKARGGGAGLFLSRLWPRRRRWQATVVVAVVLVTAVVVWWLACRPSSSSSESQYRTETVTPRTVRSTVSASGTLEPAQQSSLSFSSSGTVSTVDVAVGDSVSKNQVLASIDPSSLKVALQSAQADLAAAEDNLTSLEDSSGSTSTAISAAEAMVTVKKNAVVQAETNLNGADLAAPFAGVVASVAIAKGDTVGFTGAGSGTNGGTGSGSAGGSGSSGSGASQRSGASQASGTSGQSGSTASSTSSAAITVIDRGAYIVSASVSAGDVGSIKQGMQAVVSGTTSTEAIFGTVSSVGIVANSSGSSSEGSSSAGSTFPVTIKVTGTHTDLLPGSSVTVDITTRQRADAIAVSTDAITSKNGVTYVQRLVNGTEVKTKVTLGDVIGRTTVITSGLASGDQVVIPSFRAAMGTGTGTGGSGARSYGGFDGGHEGSGADFRGADGGAAGRGAPGRSSGSGGGQREAR